MDETQKRHIAQIVRVISDIMGGQTQVLHRIERGLVEQSKASQVLSERVGLLDKKVTGGFTVLENNRLASMDRNVTERLKSLDYSFLKSLKNKIDAIQQKLQQQINIQLLKLLIKKSKQVVIAPHIKARIGPPSRTPAIARMPTVPTALPHTPTATAQVQVTAEMSEEGWAESEIEGGMIFDTIITGWKQRDWEKLANGTREMFMRAWKKLSNSDRQKIKNGAWSKPIINKMKMLSREI